MLRLQKFLAQAGLGSRRSCEQLIKDNKVFVNGKLAVLGTKVAETDEVTFEGERVLLKIADLKVIMLNKPRGVLSSKKDDKKIKLVFDFLPTVQNEPDWIAVGRLDINTSGLMLFTNDGTFAHQLMHPSFEIDREYLVRSRGHFNEQKKKNIHIKSGKSKEDFVKLRDARDAKLAMPKLIVPSLQVNMRAGNMPEPDAQGDVFLKVPINKM